MHPATSRRRLGPLPVVVAALAAFLATLTFLAVRVRTGHDPALGSMEASAPAPPVRHVLVRRLVERRVVIKIKPAPEGGRRARDERRRHPIAASTLAARGGSGTRASPSAGRDPILMTELHDATFDCMGCEIRLLLEGPDAHARGAAAQRWLSDFDARLSRFRPDSELTRLNAEPRQAAPASALLRAAVRSGLWAAEQTGGLVDPTLLDALEAAGYRSTRRDAEPASLREALAVAPPRRPARPHPAARWRDWTADDDAGCVRRPPGSRFDTGGIGKGLAADAVAHLVGELPRFAIDCAGDVRIGGREAASRPFQIDVHHPLGGEVVHRLDLGWGAVATSGLDVRVWRTPDGDYAHHLINPATGEPAWTGVLSATALAASALEAETLAKAALLSGPAGARRILRATGGVVVHDDGDVELVGPIHERRRLRLSQRVRIAA